MFEHSYTALLDSNADIRDIYQYYYAHGTSMSVLENGHMLSTGDEYRYLPYNMQNLYEYNWLGKYSQNTEYQMVFTMIFEK